MQLPSTLWLDSTAKVLHHPPYSANNRQCWQPFYFVKESELSLDQLCFICSTYFLFLGFYQLHDVLECEQLTLLLPIYLAGETLVLVSDAIECFS